MAKYTAFFKRLFYLLFRQDILFVGVVKYGFARTRTCGQCMIPDHYIYSFTFVSEARISQEICAPDLLNVPASQGCNTHSYTPR